MKFPSLKLTNSGGILFIFVFALTTIAALNALFTAFDYSKTWMHPEIYLVESRHLNEFLHPNWRGIANFFNCQFISDDCKRTRFLSYLIGYINGITRFWLIKFMPPHPSLAVTWPLVVAGVIFFYKYLLNISSSRTASLAGVTLYISSAGFLSMFAIAFNPAKPLAAFFAPLFLYLISSWIRAPKTLTAFGILITLLLAYCSDESVWVLYPIGLILLFGALKIRTAFFIAYLLSFPLFLLFITYVVPIATIGLYDQPFEFWNWTFSGYPKEISLIDRIDFSAILFSIKSMADSQFYSWAIFVLILVAGLLSSLLKFEKYKYIQIKIIIIFIIFSIYQSFITLRMANVIGYTVSGTYYYGSLFPFFSIPIFTILIGDLSTKKLYYYLIIIITIPFFSYKSIIWFDKFNNGWIEGHNKIYAQILSTPEKNLSLNNVLTFNTARSYWISKGANINLLSPKDSWLILETQSLK